MVWRQARLTKLIQPEARRIRRSMSTFSSVASEWRGATHPPYSIISLIILAHRESWYRRGRPHHVTMRTFIRLAGSERPWFTGPIICTRGEFGEFNERLDQGNSSLRKTASVNFAMTRLMVTSFVVDHPEESYFASNEEKTTYSTEVRGIPLSDLPQ